jgi:hypothetical protein
MQRIVIMAVLISWGAIVPVSSLATTPAEAGIGANVSLVSQCVTSPWGARDLADIRADAGVYVGFLECDEGQEPCISQHCCCGQSPWPPNPCSGQCCDATCVAECVDEGTCCDL